MGRERGGEGIVVTIQRLTCPGVRGLGLFEVAVMEGQDNEAMSRHELKKRWTNTSHAATASTLLAYPMPNQAIFHNTDVDSDSLIPIRESTAFYSPCE